MGKTVGELVVRLPAPLHERLLERTAAEEREPAEAVVEAVERWLEEREAASERERALRAIERTGLLVPPEEKRYALREPMDEETREQERQRLRKILAKLKTPLSEDIIRDRG